MKNGSVLSSTICVLTFPNTVEVTIYSLVYYQSFIENLFTVPHVFLFFACLVLSFFGASPFLYASTKLFS